MAISAHALPTTFRLNTHRDMLGEEQEQEEPGIQDVATESKSTSVGGVWILERERERDDCDVDGS